MQTRNLGGFALTPDDMDRIEQTPSGIEIVGARLPESILQLSYR